MSEHTKGPWIIEGENRHGGRFIRTPDDSRGYHVAICDTYDVEMRHDQAGETEANARLIAAAPDMLAALRDLTESCACARYVGNPKEADRLCPGCENARAIIRKATNGGA